MQSLMKNDPPSVHVRQAQPADASELARLNMLFNESHEPAEAYAARLQDPRRVDWPLLAEIGGLVVGFANLRLVPAVFYPEPYAEVTELFVDEAFRRRGAARALLLHAEELARQAGASQLLVLTGDDNIAAQEFYRSQGYDHYDISMVKEF
jgi:ribosomal protein S18 acetylase RimI-like enzyme